MEDPVRLLAQVPLLARLPEAELQHLAVSLRTRQFSAGEIVFNENEHGDSFFIVRKGLIEVVKHLGQPGEQSLARRGPGEFVGEMSLFNREGQRTASVRAAGPSTLWELSRQDFDALLHRQPLLAYEMVRVLGDRLNIAHNTAVRDLESKNRQLTEAYQSLQAAQAQIIEKERLERELQVAHEIQMSILPQALPVLEGFNFGAQLISARSVGGDFYGFVPLDDGQLGIFLGDVTDKGVPAAIFMAQVHAFITAEAERGRTPAQVLQRANHHLVQRDENGLFVTVIYGVLDRVKRQFTYARAGHDLPIIYTPGQGAVLASLQVGQPLGLFAEPLLDEQTIVLPEGSCFLLYTDGITEQRGPGGVSFGAAWLLEMVAQAGGLSARELCAHVLQAVKVNLHRAVQDDDLTLLAVQTCPA